MHGRITSSDPGIDRHGRPWPLVLDEQRRIHDRLQDALARALRAWLAYDCACREDRQAKVQRALRLAAVELTELALG